MIYLSKRGYVLFSYEILYLPSQIQSICILLHQSLPGAGKSTLVRLVNQLERVSEGKVIVDGHELDTYKEKELRNVKKEIGMIFFFICI